MNTLFNNNINTLYIKNKVLAIKLETYVPTDIPKLAKKENIYNLYYKEKLIHNADNPLLEAKSIFSGADNQPASVHLIYGLGLGYLFQVASLNSKGLVILYEPDLNILKTVFSMVDFTKDLLKNNVFIVDNIEDLTELLYAKSGINHLPQMLSLPYYNTNNEQEFNSLVKRLQEIVGSFSLDLKYAKEKFYPSLKMFLQNFPHLFNETPLIYLKDKYKDKTAVVISAGPTLDENIETIKKYRDRIVIFVVGTAFKTLYRHGIKPDFLLIIETYDSSKQITDVDLSDINLITEPFSNPNLRNFKFKNTYLHMSSNTPINHLWSEISEENIEEYWSKGTVSYTAINSARILGCKKIVLVGQDLAYIEGQCYSKDSIYKDLVCTKNENTNKWEITAKDFSAFSEAISNSPDAEIRKQTAKRRLDNLNNSLYYIKGINGDMIPTESVYATFIEPLKEYAKHFNDRIYINTSLKGAQIDGYENIPLEKALEDTVPFERPELKTDFAYDKENILTNLKLKLDELQEALPLIDEGEGLSRNILNTTKRTKIINQDILKLLKKLSELYLKMSSEFADKSKIYDYITISDKLELDYIMKTIQNFDVRNVTKISEKMYEYFENAKTRINEIVKSGKEILEKIK